MNSEVFARSTPASIPPFEQPARPTETERRLMQAQDLFNTGKQAYDRGDLDQARTDFNKAVDLLLATPDAPDRGRIERRLDQIVDAIYRFDVNGMGAGDDPDQVVYDKSPLESILQMTFPIDPRLKSKVKDEIQATVSQLPLEVNDTVLSYIHFFSSERGRKILVSGLRRAGRYKPLIQRILDEEGVPQELIFLAQAESGFLPRAISNKQATGMWQFVKWRGQEYGLTQTSASDDRLDPEKATRAAAKHLRDLYTQFGDWYLAMAAYNCGPGCVDKAVQRTGYADFFKLASLGALPRETQNYVPLILAMTIMVKNPKDYGLEGVEADAALEYETVKLKAPTSLSLLADVSERPVSEIRELNPGLLRATAPLGYEIRVPKGTGAQVASALENIPADRRATWRMHRVGAGETIADIAKRYRTAATSIAQANPRFVDSPSAGEVLIIPATYDENAVKISKRHGKARPVRTLAAGKARSTRTARMTPVASKSSTKNLHRKAQPARVRTASARRAAATE